jgi:gas vesicle protein
MDEANWSRITRIGPFQDGRYAVCAIGPRIANQSAENKDMNIRELTYLGLGAAVGVAAAVLFAPRPGTETREFLRSKAEDGTDFVRTGAADVLDAVSKMTERGKNAVRYQTENLAAAVDAGVETYRVGVQTTP